MLSILIPTYQYNVLPLVKELHQQCSNYKVVFEILVMDDASPELVVDHLQLALLPFCTYLSLDKNIGRAAVRNKLAAKAQFSDRKSTRLNSSHVKISYAVFCLKKKKTK